MTLFESIDQSTGLEKWLWIIGPVVGILVMLEGVRKIAEPKLGAKKAEKLAERIAMAMLALYVLFSFLVISSGDGA
ncbi:hypothetical protein V5T82_04560 [Magnetovibrio sp. PR-2]|uniref:hypothetical protein n=1 Tax=Magnetovibrio sp. PR-2 TaxID=3120356 RepID=UPI002FCE2AD6